MEKLLIASMRRNTGKTSMIVGMAKALGKKISYLKPFGERLVYEDKHLWDYDAELINGVFNLGKDPREMSIGFHHSKMRYLFDRKKTEAKLGELIKKAGKGSEVLFIEGGRDFGYGMSVHLDPVSLARMTGGKLVVVLSGNLGKILDDVTFLCRNIDLEGIEFPGIIVNKMQDLYDFRNNYVKKIEELGIHVLGVIPYNEELDHVSMDYIRMRLGARVIAGQDALDNVVKAKLIGAMSLNAVLQTPLFEQERKLLITAGDRSDIVLAALESDTSGIILTNNILPPANIISRAEEAGIPLLLAREDTFKVTKAVDDMETLFTSDETGKVNLLTDMIREHVDLDTL